MKIFFNSIFLLLMLLFIAGCGGNAGRQPYRDSQILLGTFVTITSYDTNLDPSLLRTATDSAFAVMRRIESLTNPYDPHSEIARINRAAHRQRRFALSAELLPLVKRALQISRETNGAYDPTLWPVFRLWHFGTDSAAVPPADSLHKYLPGVNFRQLSLRGDSLAFGGKNMGIDLSGISKGYAVEKARETLNSFGPGNYIIDAGGNLGIEWHRDKPVNIYIRHPRESGAFFGHFPVRASCGIATSGDYQNFFRQDSVVYHHILDPGSGFPVRRTVSVTVKAPDATTADGLSTALFVMGPDSALNFLEKNRGLEGVVIFEEGDSLSCRVSSGLEDSFQKTAPAKPAEISSEARP